MFQKIWYSLLYLQDLNLTVTFTVKIAIKTFRTPVHFTMMQVRLTGSTRFRHH